AIEVATTRFDGWTPLVVADPGMGRYQASGNLFARVRGTVHRLDRHPAMSRHPVTPMDEADLCRHLARQTELKTGLVDFVAIKDGEADAQLEREVGAGARIVSIDVLDQQT